MLEYLRKTSPAGLMAWMLSAFAAGLGTGLLLADPQLLAPGIILALAGWTVHLTMMVKIYRKR